MVKILPRGDANAMWTHWLDALTVHALSMSPYPILFRPFHEMYQTGNWWGAKYCSAGMFIAGWRYTAEYLRVSTPINVHFRLPAET